MPFQTREHLFAAIDLPVVGLWSPDRVGFFEFFCGELRWVAALSRAGMNAGWPRTYFFAGTVLLPAGRIDCQAYIRQTPPSSRHTAR